VEEAVTHIHTHANTHTHIYTHAYTHTHTHTRTHAHTHTHTLQTHRKAVLKLGVEEAECKHIQRDKGLEKQFRSAYFSLNPKPKTLNPSTYTATGSGEAVPV
jgi:hypothetical protein